MPPEVSPSISLRETPSNSGTDLEVLWHISNYPPAACCRADAAWLRQPRTPPEEHFHPCMVIAWPCDSDFHMRLSLLLQEKNYSQLNNASQHLAWCLHMVSY